MTALSSGCMSPDMEPPVPLLMPQSPRVGCPTVRRLGAAAAQQLAALGCPADGDCGFKRCWAQAFLGMRLLPGAWKMQYCGEARRAGL